MTSETQTAQVIICGSGCAGSLLAWILARQGMEVVLIDRGRHPRFAIGESSTPLADFLLEKMADDFNLPELRPLARWGSWKKVYPNLRVGKKRGFSYYGHTPGAAHDDDQEHHHSLLVAASATDEVSDTQWMRADVDQWLCQQAAASGASLFENTTIETLERERGQWRITASQHGQPLTFHAPWLVDATGTGGIVPKTGGIQRIDDQLLTQTGSLFGHFTGVGAMPEWLHSHGLPCNDDPFNSDDAAQHQVLADGWVWMLRFDCGITSVGITRPTRLWKAEQLVERDLDAAWQHQVTRYPTLADLMSHAELIGPFHNEDGRASLGWMPRLSRLWAQGSGDGWLALPSTVGVIDPLHSTGIAHALSGVWRAANLLSPGSQASCASALMQYGREVVEEVKWIDQLVAICYSGLPDFELFTAACSFYFVGAHSCEEELRDTGQLPHGVFGSKRPDLQSLLARTAAELRSGQPLASKDSKARFIETLRQGIKPWNKIGLLDPKLKNRYSRSATKFS